MKKISFIIVTLTISCILAISILFSQRVTHKHSGAGEEQVGGEIKIKPLKNHLNTPLKCKTCHISEYPTLKDPGLMSCPRHSMYGEFPSSEEGPEVVVIDEMSENYTGVVFYHRLHSEMSEMGVGCTDCHHFNTSGPVINCRECHSNVRYRENVSVPDLKAAFHRQCISCHKQWSHENGCSSQCHLYNTPENQKNLKKDLTGKKHPKRTEPTKIIYEINCEYGNKVTFYHDEHVNLFRIECVQCHSSDRCVKCHDKKIKLSDNSKTAKIEKSFEEHHKPCFNCHKENACQKCHADEEMARFNHGKSTGWILKSYHNRLSCMKCHKNQMPVKRLDRNCNTCHKDFVYGKFDHNKTGLFLSDSHKNIECINCHDENDFTKNPECKICHNDKFHPAHLPGKRRY